MSSTVPSDPIRSPGSSVAGPPPRPLPAGRPADLLRRVRLIELRARRLVEDLLAGPYRSVFRGRGIEFDEVRGYQPGDDVRSIDWHTTARTGHVQVKQHVEERCLTVMLAVDLSASGDFGSGPQSKRELAAELVAALALSAVLNNDRVGLLLFTDRVERYFPPRTGRRQVLAIVAAVLGHVPCGTGTSLRLALQVLGSTLRRRALVFLVSDFLDHGFERPLRIAARRHDLVALAIQDDAEATLPRLGWLACEDAETGEVVELDTDNPGVRRAFEVETRGRAAALRELLRRADVKQVGCLAGSGSGWQRALWRLFAGHGRRADGGAAAAGAG